MSAVFNAAKTAFAASVSSVGVTVLRCPTPALGGRRIDSNRHADADQVHDQRVDAELVEPPAQEIVHARLGNPDAARGLGLGPLPRRDLPLECERQAGLNRQALRLGGLE